MEPKPPVRMQDGDREALPYQWGRLFEPWFIQHGAVAHNQPGSLQLCIQTHCLRQREAIYWDSNPTRAMPGHSTPASSLRINFDGAKMYLTNLKNHVIVKHERSIISSVFALYRGFSRKGIWTIINAITNNRQYEDEIEFFDKKASRRSTNEDSVIRAAIQEHRAVFGLANPAEKKSELKKDKERYCRLLLQYFVFLDRELECKADMKLSEEKNEEWERRKAALMGKRFNAVAMCNIESHL